MSDEITTPVEATPAAEVPLGGQRELPEPLQPAEAQAVLADEKSLALQALQMVDTALEAALALLPVQGTPRIIGGTKSLLAFFEGQVDAQILEIGRL